MMRVGIASDHGGFALKREVAESLRAAGYEVVDFGAQELNPEDDYPDFGDRRELSMVEEQPGEEAPYERLLGDAMAGDGALFTREDAVEAAWAVVDPFLKTHHRTLPYQRGTWGPKEADFLIAPDGCRQNPKPKEASR